MFNGLEGVSYMLVYGIVGNRICIYGRGGFRGFGGLFSVSYVDHVSVVGEFGVGEVFEDLSAPWASFVAVCVSFGVGEAAVAAGA